jgi:TetR/AcrR family transcriptional regulator, cholesterol catabolism regulator
VITNDRLESHAPPGSRRQQILDAATVLFAQRGYHGASMSDIGERVGMLKGSLYAHIASKEDILLELVSTAWRRFFAAVTPALSGALPAGERIRNGLRAHVRIVAEDPDLALVLHREGRHLVGQPELWHADMVRRYESMWSAVFREAIECREFRPDLDIDAATFLALAAGSVLQQAARLTNDPRSIADRCCDVLLRGCLA